MLMKSKQAMTTKILRVSNEHHKKIKILAAKQGISIQDFIEKIIDNQLIKQAIL